MVQYSGIGFRSREPVLVLLALLLVSAFLNGVQYGFRSEGCQTDMVGVGSFPQNSGTQAEIVLITKGIEPIRSQTYENATDPHAWMDAKKGLQYYEEI